jgi:hypothetical protein
MSDTDTPQRLTTHTPTVFDLLFFFIDFSYWNFWFSPIGTKRDVTLTYFLLYFSMSLFTVYYDFMYDRIVKINSIDKRKMTLIIRRNT